MDSSKHKIGEKTSGNQASHAINCLGGINFDDQSVSSDKISEVHINSDYGDEIPEDDIEYYTVPKQPRFKEIIHDFVPTENDMYIFKGTKNQIRLIFNDECSEAEEKMYEQFSDDIENISDDNLRNQLLDLPKTEIIHIITVCGGDMDRITNEFKMLHTDELFIKPMILNTKQKVLLDKGLFYISGRDMSLCPIHVMNPHIFREVEATISD
jgi:hypothetical protein